MSEASNQFTLSAYIAMIANLLNRGFELRGYTNLNPAAPHLVLRHDVDFDLGAAVELATAEAEQGWCAYYFVLVRSEFYNVLSPAAGAAIARIRELGHDIGLHFDAAAHSVNAGQLAAEVERECTILENICGADIGSFSLHRPRADMLERGFEVLGRLNVYDSSFFRDIGYCSDSRGGWHHGPPLDHPSIAAKRALQLVTHPIWWTQPGATPGDKCAAILEARHEVLDIEMARHCRVHRPRHLLVRRDAEKHSNVE